ncbi:MAG TPA: response regulator transcription factor [Ktedonobacteraceae bacterium]|nr:response regulator transcription factor [Ktedonobacteraceae bacterium]
MATILIVEDEVDICNLIRAQLEAEGHTVFQAFDGLTALTIVDEHRPQLVVLDWMLPGMDGLSVCRRLRQNYLMPIIMLTARTEEIDRVLGLEVGADDYISKPFSIREVLARVRAMLRRVELDSRSMLTSSTASSENRASSSTGESQMPTRGIPTYGQTLPEDSPVSTPIVRGPLHIYELERIVTLEGAELELTPKEYELLLLLASHPGRAFSREFLLQQLWGYDYDGFDRTVDTHITRLRKKLGAPGEKIVTVWGVGYRFVS